MNGRALYQGPNTPDMRGFEKWVKQVWGNQAKFAYGACPSMGSSLEPFMEAALTPLVFLLEYWNQMSPEERAKWYDAKDDLLTEAGKELLKKEAQTA